MCYLCSSYQLLYKWHFFFFFGGGVFKRIVCGCACWSSRIHFTIYAYLVTIHQYTNFIKCPILLKFGVFTIICPKYTWFKIGCLHLGWNPMIAIPKFMKQHTKRQAHVYVYQSSWDAIGGGNLPFTLAFSETCYKINSDQGEISFYSLGNYTPVCNLTRL